MKITNNILSKYKQLNTPVKAAIWFTVCNILLKGLSFVTVPIFTRMIPDDEYGKLAIYAAWEQVLLIFATWEIHLGAYQKGIFNYKSNVKSFTTSTMLLINLITILLFLLLLPFNKFVLGLTGYTFLIFVLLFVYFLVFPAYNCWTIRKRTDFEYKPVVIITILYTLLTVLGAIIAIYIVDRTANVKYIATLLVSIVFCVFFYFSSFSLQDIKNAWENKTEQWGFMIRYEGPLVLHSLSYFVLNQADRIMIGKMVDDSKAAYYSVAYSLASVISLFQNSINQTLLPWRYQKLEEKDYKKIKSVTNCLLFAIGVIIIMFSYVMPEVMLFLLPKSYQEAKWCIPPVSAGIYFIFLYSIFVNIETYFEKTKYVMYVSVVCGTLNIVFNYIGIKIFGYIACAYTTMICYILFAVGHYIFMRKILKQEIPDAEVIDLKMVILISLFVIVVSVLTTLLYPYWIARYSILTIISLILIAKRKSIIGFYRELKK